MNISTVQILPGAEGIKQAYRESLSQKSLDIICLSNNYDQVIGDFFEKEFSPKVYGKISTREILPDTLGNRKSLAEKDRKINDVRFIAPVASESDMLICEDTVTLISFSAHAPVAVVITDKELVRSFQSQFNVLWEKLS